MKSFGQYITEVESWDQQMTGDDDGNLYSVKKLYDFAKSKGEAINIPIKNTDAIEWWHKSYSEKNPDDVKRMMNADTSVPVLAIRYGKKLSIADGLNRIKKAHSVEGKTHILAYIMDSEEMHALAEPRKKRKKKINEEPEIDPYIEPGETKKEPFNVSYLKKKTELFGPKSFVGHKRMGDIHPHYEMWRHTHEKTDHKGNKHHIHEFSIVHKKTREKVGEILARGGKINKKTGEHTDGTGKDMKITYLGIHDDHSAKKIGTSLAVAAYKHLHKRGHSIRSDTRQSVGGAHVWDTLRKDKDVRSHVRFHDERDNKAIPAHKLDYDSIWQENPSAQETTLVLHAKKKKPALVSEDIESRLVNRSLKSKKK